jgi:hypothetical protein
MQEQSADCKQGAHRTVRNGNDIFSFGVTIIIKVHFIYQRMIVAFYNKFI